jgi:phage head maturation protease
VPLNRCQDDDKPGWKWGDAGKCYVYTAGNEESEKAARKKALAQAAAMGEFPGTGQSNRSRRESVEIRTAPQVKDVDFVERIIDVVAVPYDEEAVVEYNGRMVVESVSPKAFDGIETRNTQVPANRDHDPGRTFGKVIAWHNDPHALLGRIYASDTPLGNESLRLAADGVLKASIGMLIRRSDQVLRGDTRRVNRAFVDHVALAPNPAYLGAGVLAVRQESGLLAAEEAPRPTPNLDEILTLLGMQD